MRDNTYEPLGLDNGSSDGNGTDDVSQRISESVRGLESDMQGVAASRLHDLIPICDVPDALRNTAGLFFPSSLDFLVDGSRPSESVAITTIVASCIGSVKDSIL